MMLKAVEHKGYKFNVLVNFKPLVPKQRLVIFDGSQQANKKRRPA